MADEIQPTIPRELIRFIAEEVAKATTPSEQEKGIDRRDYFAAAALQGIIASGGLRGLADDMAAVAYRVADEMLKARETV